MSNVTMFNGSNVPAFARNRAGASSLAKSLAGGEISGNRISIKGGTFRLISGGKEIAQVEERYLDVVVVNAAPKIARVFYMKAYDGDTPSGPDCWSPDGEKPSDDAVNKQSETCASCSQNIAGSGNGNSRACRYQQRLAVVLANNISGDVLQLTAPATSIFGKEDGDNRPLQAYARWLAAQNMEPTEIITRIKFDQKSESPKLFFKAMRWLTDDEHEIVSEKSNSTDAIKAITMTVAKMDNVPAAVSVQLEGKRPEATKNKKEKPVVVDEDEEPAVRKEVKKPSAVPPKDANLAAAVADWDDE